MIVRLLGHLLNQLLLIHDRCMMHFLIHDGLLRWYLYELIMMWCLIRSLLREQERRNELKKLSMGVLLCKAIEQRLEE